MDNLDSHKIDGIRSAIETDGATFIYLTPHWPDYSPFAPCYSKLKKCLHAIKARTRDVLNEAPAHVIDRVTNTNTKGRFTHCSYLLNILKSVLRYFSGLLNLIMNTTQTINKIL
jgi:hypothetical protein